KPIESRRRARMARGPAACLPQGARNPEMSRMRCVESVARFIAPMPSPSWENGAAMAKHPADDQHLAKLTKLCLALPEAARRDTGDHAAFLVRKKVFAYYLNNHHGDGRVAVCAKMALGENADRVAADPARFYLPAYIGPRGWAALRLDAGA